MNYRLILNTIGKVLRIEGALMLLPAIVSLIYKEWSGAMAFFVVLLGAILVGQILVSFVKPKNQFVFAKEGLVIVALVWTTVSLVGAIPFVVSGAIPNFIDALFETVSGFSTTGASVLDNVESMAKGMLFWRSFTHWIGGMGVLVFVMAFTGKTTDRSMHILRAEMPGPIVDKVVPKAKTTTLILYLIYLVMTALLIVLLLCGGMPLFDSVVHAFGTAGTGGFGIKADSIAGYSAYLKWVIAIFMTLFGINFNMYFLILVGKIGSFFKSRELWTYLGVMLVGTAIIAINIFNIYGNLSDTITHAFFQASSVMTTTGYATADFNAWPTISKTVLFILMFIGACAGSTGGGFKVSRMMILFKKIGGDVKRVLHPNTATIVKIEGKKVDDSVLSGVVSYTVLYSLIILVVFVILSFDPQIASATAFETNFTATVSCINNIGPGLAEVGPSASYACYSEFSKVVLTLTMLLGRLEIYPILLAITPTTWLKK